MASDPQRIEHLTLAASFCLFDRRLRSSGNSSIIWGALNALIGLLIINARNPWGAVSLVLGLGLIGTGMYERKVRDPKVIILSAATLASLAFWNFLLIGLAAVGKVQTAMGGRTLFWAIAQSLGAYAIWKTYSTYKMVREKSDPSLVQEVRGYMEELKQAKPEQTLDLVEFDANPGFLQATRRYKLKPIDGLYLVARYKAELGKLQLEDINFIPRAELTLTAEGQKWMSKKIKATVQLGRLRLNKVTVTPEMAARISPAARVIALGDTQ